MTSLSVWYWSLPEHVLPPKVPSDNPMSEAKFQLGRQLFYDRRLSANGSLSCASCHLQERAFSDGRASSIGATGEQTPRNAQGLANVAWSATLTWANPSLVLLERQMEVPLYGVDPVEMGVNDRNQDSILARFRADARSSHAFATAFPGESDPIRMENIIKAVAVFQRAMISFGSRYDHYLEGKLRLTAREMRGRDLFFGPTARCSQCHGSVNFNDQFMHAGTRTMKPLFHNTGRYDIDGKGAFNAPNRGVFELTGMPSDMGRFRAPSLRNVAVTGPYMHDGSMSTLSEVLDFYGAGGRVINAGDDPVKLRGNPLRSEVVRGIFLSRKQKQDLRAFLETLTDKEFLNNPRFGNPNP